jgi:hypothetical protein
VTRIMIFEVFLSILRMVTAFLSSQRQFEKITRCMVSGKREGATVHSGAKDHSVERKAGHYIQLPCLPS